jgi:hypothetical protein
MRSLMLCAASVLFFATTVAAQTVDGVAAGAVSGATGRGGLTAGGQLQGRGSVAVPSGGHSGSGRAVGANFDARRGAQVDADISASGRARVGGSRVAAARARFDARADVETDAESRQPRSRTPGRPEAFDPSSDLNRHILHADLQLAHRLSEIDRLRDHALTHDDVNLLMRADILEQQARIQHQRHVAQMQITAQQGQGVRAGFEADAQGNLRIPQQSYPGAQAGFPGQARGGQPFEADAELTRPYVKGEVLGGTDGEFQVGGSPEFNPSIPPNTRPYVKADGQAEAQGNGNIRIAPRP